MKYNILYLFILIALGVQASPDPALVVLPNNGNVAPNVAPQDTLVYQRQFYLIRAAEMQRAGFQSSMPINGIGFTNALAPDSLAKGLFKVYLQNTTDQISRIDTTWSESTVTGTRLRISGLAQGDYEVQVIGCSGSSSDTGRTTFSNLSVPDCGKPTSLNATATSNGAIITWVGPATGITSIYNVEYDTVNGTSWTTDTTSSFSKTLTGLVSGKVYRYRISRVCSGNIYSDYAEGFFTTETPVSGCIAPTGLIVQSVTDTTANIRWNAASGATRYDVQYRRQFTTNWSGTISFTNTINVSGLKPGTTYEWRVRSVCSLGNGAYVSSAANIVTTGTTVCYSPSILSTDSITQDEAVLTWNNTGASGYKLRYRVRKFISWDKALQRNQVDSMLLVHDDSLKIPATSGSYSVAFAGTGITPFTYTGGAVYVAFEYSHIAPALLRTATQALATFGDSVIKNINGTYDSLSYPNSFGSSGRLGFQNILTSKSRRPETLFSSPQLKDSIEITKVYTLSNAALGYSNTIVRAIIKNLTTTKRVFNVSLVIQNAANGTNRFSSSLTTDSIPANGSLQVTFAQFTPTIIEKDSIIVSIPAFTGETYTFNNRVGIIQNVNSNIVSHCNSSDQVSGAGFGSSQGMLLAKYRMTGCGKVNAVQAYLTRNSTSDTLYGVILNDAGTIIDRTEMITPDSSMTEAYKSFYFNNPPALQNQNYYVGIVQKSKTTPSLPLGVQYDGSSIRDSAFFTADTTGAGLASYIIPGNLMIRAEVIYSLGDAFVTGKTAICAGESNTLKAIQINSRYANRVISYSSQKAGYAATEVLGTPNVYPDSTITNNVWLSQTADGQRESLVVDFPNPSPANFIDIFEVFGAGAVDTVEVYDAVQSIYHTVYTGNAAGAGNARRNRITFPLTTYNVSRVKIKINAPAVTGYYAIDAIAVGNIDTTASALSYLWSTTETTQAISASNAGSYFVTINNANGCASTASATLFAAPAITPVITAIRPLVFCAGDSVILRSNQTGGNTWSNGSTLDSITVKTVGSYFVSYNSGTGCPSVQSTPVSVVVNQNPTVNISGQTAICPGGNTTLTADSGFVIYLWSNSATTRAITVGGFQTYTVTVTDGNGCKGKKTANTTVAAVPSPSITGNNLFCPGSSLSLGTGTFSSYVWNTGANTQNISTTTGGTFTVTVTNTFGCTGSASKTVGLYTPPAPSISGLSSFCQGASTILTANIGYNSYSWNTGGNTRNLTVTTPGTYTVTVTDGNGCTGTSSRAASYYPSPTPIITGDTTFCNNSSSILDAGITYAGYLWSTGATTHSISVNTSATYSVIVTDNNGCTGSSSVTTNNNSASPSTPGAITGQLTGLCNASSKVFTVAPVSGAASYYWTIPAGDSIISGQGSNSITVRFNNFQVAFLSVVALNNCGQSSPSTTQIIGLPDAVGPISGRIDGVCRSNGYTYSIIALDGATSYTWTVPIGATLVSGQGSNSISVNYGSGFSGGNICVTASNACGTSSRCLAIRAIPAVPTGITGPSGVCRKAQGVTYTCPAVLGATTYNWTVPNGSRVVSGQGTTTVRINFGTTAGNVSVRAGNACGNSTYFNYAVVFNCREDGSNESLVDGLAEAIAFPNPNTGKFTVSFNAVSAEKYTIRIMDLLGNIILVQDGISTEGNNLLESDLSPYAKGMYILMLETQGTPAKTMKIIVE